MMTVNCYNLESNIYYLQKFKMEIYDDLLFVYPKKFFTINMFVTIKHIYGCVYMCETEQKYFSLHKRGVTP